MESKLFKNGIKNLSKSWSAVIPFFTLLICTSATLAGGFNAGGGITINGSSIEDSYKPFRTKFPEESVLLQEKFDALSNNHHSGLASVLEQKAFEDLKFYILPVKLKDLPFEQMGLDFIKNKQNLKIQQACLNLGKTIYCSEADLASLKTEDRVTLFMHEITMSLVMEVTRYPEQINDVEKLKVYSAQLMLNTLAPFSDDRSEYELEQLNNFFKIVQSSYKDQLVKLSQELHNNTRDLVTSILWPKENANNLVTRLINLNLKYLVQPIKTAVIYQSGVPNSPALVYRYIGTTVDIFSCPSDLFAEIRHKQAEYSNDKYPGISLDIRKMIVKKASSDNELACTPLLGNKVLSWNNTDAKTINSKRIEKQQQVVSQAQSGDKLRVLIENQYREVGCGIGVTASMSELLALALGAKNKWLLGATAASMIFTAYNCYKVVNTNQKALDEAVKKDIDSLWNDAKGRSIVMNMALINDLSFADKQVNFLDISDSNKISHEFCKWQKNNSPAELGQYIDCGELTWLENFYDGLQIGNLNYYIKDTVELLINSGVAQLVPSRERR